MFSETKQPSKTNGKNYDISIHEHKRKWQLRLDAVDVFLKFILLNESFLK